MGPAIRDFRPDVLITLGDVWMVDWIKALPERQHCRLVTYVPLDGAPFYQPWAPFLRSADRVVACARFGSDLLRSALPDLDVTMIPHGVDTTVFRPLPDFRRPRELEGRFIVGCTARNQPRKNLPVLVEAFSAFSRQYDDAVLYLHSDPDDVGWDLLDLLRRHRVFNRTCLTRSSSITSGVTPQRLNELYNLFDVMALPTGGEGFGLPIVEAMAAGTPVVATNHSACVEHLEAGKGHLINVKTHFTAGRHNIDYALADAEHLCAVLAQLHDTPTEREHQAQAGRAYARSLDWTAVTTQWEDLLADVGRR